MSRGIERRLARLEAKRPTDPYGLRDLDDTELTALERRLGIVCRDCGHPTPLPADGWPAPGIRITGPVLSALAKSDRASDPDTEASARN